jgi:hypothetical protein
MARKPPIGKSLAEVNPELALEWHPTLNGSIAPSDVSFGSDKKVWWKCTKGNDHEWLASVGHRMRGRGCAICSGKKVVYSTSLAKTHPDLVNKKWHPTKNGERSPLQISSGSHKKVWWKCPKGDDHEWEKSVSEVVKGKGCPVCSGHKIVLSNCLATTHPEFAKEWHPSLNKGMTPYDITKGRTSEVWWKCSRGDDHVWLTSPNNRTSNSKGNCPICEGKIVVESTSLVTLNPEIAKEWHPTKNGKLTPFDVTIRSSKKVWWKCPKGDDHVWVTSVSHRSNGTICPFCANQKVSNTNSLFAAHPELSKEWHPTKNGELTPIDVIVGSNKKVWWKCPEEDDHEWLSSINARAGSRKTGCPMCFGFAVVKSNSLLNKFPRIAKELHLTKNKGISAADLFYSSSQKYWWKCPKGDDHEWKTTVRHRTHSKSNCPYCTLTPQSKQELTITFELLQFFDINPKGFKTKVDGRIWSIDIYIPELTLGIEFDGSYWHKDKRALDKLKTEQLQEGGFKIMRIREEPLMPITEIDVVSKQPFNAKKVTDDILRHITEAYIIDGMQLAKINRYLGKNTTQNETRLDEYIDQILEEKSKKKGTTTKPKPPFKTTNLQF